MTLSTPQAVTERLEQIDQELALKANDFEQNAHDWFRAKRTKEHQHAIEFKKAEGTVAERNEWANEVTALIGSEYEAAYEAMKAKVKLLEARASIGMSILRSQGRSGG